MYRINKTFPLSKIAIPLKFVLFEIGSQTHPESKVRRHLVVPLK